jgi:hypothetical protein
MPNCISLDQTNVSVTLPGPPRTLINCLPSNDLEMWFRGTICCEMGDLDQTPTHQKLIHLFVFQKQTVPG